MPIYDFRCFSCSHQFDELVPMNTEGDNLKCPACGHIGARRLVSAFAAHGLENGHIAVGRKLTGGSSGSSTESDSSTKTGDSSGSSTESDSSTKTGTSSGTSTVSDSSTKTGG